MNIKPRKYITKIIIIFKISFIWKGVRERSTLGGSEGEGLSEEGDEGEHVHHVADAAQHRHQDDVKYNNL